MTSDLDFPGAAPPHRCDQPTLNLSTRHGAIWRCECGRRWRLSVEQISNASWRGEWKRLGPLRALALCLPRRPQRNTG